MRQRLRRGKGVIAAHVLAEIVAKPLDYPLDPRYVIVRRDDKGNYHLEGIVVQYAYARAVSDALFHERQPVQPLFYRAVISLQIEKAPRELPVSAYDRLFPVLLYAQPLCAAKYDIFSLARFGIAEYLSAIQNLTNVKAAQIVYYYILFFHGANSPSFSYFVIL